MAIAILAPAKNALPIPSLESLDIRRNKPHGQAAASAIGLIGFRAMQDPVGMQGNLARLKFDVHGIHVITVQVVYGLAQHIVLSFCAAAEGYLALMMGTGQNPHGTVFLIGIVNGEPNGYCLAGREWPKGGVLVPRDGLAVAGQLAEIVGTPTNQILSQQSPEHSPVYVPHASDPRYCASAGASH